MTLPPEKSRAVPAIATGGLIVGILDITSAFITWWCRGGSDHSFFCRLYGGNCFLRGGPHVLVSNAIRCYFRFALWHRGLPLHVLVRSAVRIS